MKIKSPGTSKKGYTSFPDVHHRYLAGVTLIISARFLNQEPGSYFDWKFQEGIKERSADFDYVRVGVESP